MSLNSLNVGLVARVCYTLVFGGVGGNVMLLFKLVGIVVVVVLWCWWLSSGAGDGCCRGWQL